MRAGSVGDDVRRIADGVRRRVRYSGVRAEPGIVLRELDVDGERMLLADVEGSVAVEVVAGEVGQGAYDFRDIDIAPGDTILDIGAHIGIVSIYLAKRHPDARILAFEAVPRVFDLLVANVKRNKVRNVVPFNVAVTGDGRDLDLVSHPQSNTGGGSAYAADHALPGHDRVTVPSVTLDQILDRHDIGHCPLLKIDIEGAEYEVLYEAKRLPVIANIRGEFHENAYLMSNGYSMDELRDYCDDLIGAGRTRFTRCHMPDV
ncbi:MAG: pv [Actinomycetia bacterium]|nr:pv [Actinomycetes bacterium]